VARVPTDASAETSTGASQDAATPVVPGQRNPRPAETSSDQSGPFTGLVAALRTGTAPRPVVVPAPQAPPPGSRLLAICGWAVLLDLAGLAVAVRGLIALAAGHAPHWYLASLLISGAAGIGLTAAAFLSVRQRLIPWLLLGAGTAALVTSAVFTANAT
jgi:hypothetical protein